MKKIILIILLFISSNIFSQTLTTYYSFKTYPNSANRNIYWYGVNFSRVDSVLHVLSTGSSFSLSDFHAFTGINTFANGTYFNDSAKFTRIVIMDSLKVNNRISGYGSLIDSLSASFLRSGTVPMARLSDSTFKLSNLDTTRFLDYGSDTSHYVHTDTLTTERVKSKTEFSDVVTFFLSPVFSAVVTFANGIITTTLTTSGTATFNGDVINTGKRYQGSDKNIYKYYRDTLIWTVCGSTGTTVSVAHGIANISNICMFTYQIKDDSSGLVLTPNATNATLVGSGLIYYPPYIDATNINIRIASSMVNLDNNTDTIKYFLRVTDYNR